MMKKNSESEPISVWDKVANGFGKIGPAYWDGFGEKLVEGSQICQGQTIIDIGCGRGASLFPAAISIGLTGKAIGIDTSIGMILSTQHEVHEKKLENVSLECTSITDFSYGRNSADCILCGFGIGFLEADKDRYAKIAALLKATGTFGISAWTQQKDQEWMTKLVNKHLDLEVEAVSGKSEKSRDMVTEEGIRRILESAGFCQIEIKKVSRTFVFRNSEEWWQDLNYNAVKNIIDALDEKGSLAAFKNEAFEGINQYRHSDGIHIEREAIIAYCVKQPC